MSTVQPALRYHAKEIALPCANSGKMLKDFHGGSKRMLWDAGEKESGHPG